METVLCVFCRVARRVYQKRHLSSWEFMVITAAAISLLYAIGSDFYLPIFAIWGFLLFATEVITFLRWRVKLVCPHCHFDPILYKKSPKLAGQKISERLANRAEDPDAIFGPALQVPKRMR